MIKTSQEQLINLLLELDLPRNHVYVIHSSMLKFGLFEGGLAGIMKCLYLVLGAESTILMPAFTLSFGQSRVWDYHNSKAETGALCEYFRKLPTAIRTIHPFHSMAVSGPLAHKFEQCTNLSSFGENSPYALLYEMGAFNIALGIGLVGGATFLHHAEEEAKVPYRLYKEFPGEVINKDGKKLPNTYKMFARDIAPGHEYRNVWDHVLNDFLTDGLAVEKNLNGATILSFSIKPAHDRIVERMKQNPFYIAKKIIN